MAKAPAVQFYSGDFLTGTTLMTNEEVGLYIRLLCLQAENGSVPDDPERMSAVYGPSVLKVWPAVRAKFIAGNEAGTMVNEKMSKVLADREAFRLKQSEKGKASAEARLTSGSKKKKQRFNHGSTTVEPLGGRGRDISQERKERASEPIEAKVIPMPFTSEAFALAWADWELSRREIKKPLTATSRKAQLAKCLEWGESRAIAALRHSTAGGYQGIYEPTNRTTNGPVAQSQTERDQELARIVAARYAGQ